MERNTGAIFDRGGSNVKGDRRSLKVRSIQSMDSMQPLRHPRLEMTRLKHERGAQEMCTEEEIEVAVRVGVSNFVRGFDARRLGETRPQR